MIKAVIFDFYGVIYSNFDWDVIDERIYGNELSATKFKMLIQQANAGEISNTELLSLTGQLAGDDKYPGRPAVKAEPSLNYRALELIESLRPRYKIGLLSNGSSNHISSVLEPTGGVNKFFDAVITSADSRYSKPAKEAFTDMLKLLEMKPAETLLIDDSPRHIAGARSVGLLTLRFNDMTHLRADLADLGVE